ncbi:MAG TPA: MFS transporter [Burkholderiales bacterium]|jgi:MFS family permease|nr:MFS transporter [Burkholderiales bacterium]
MTSTPGAEATAKRNVFLLMCCQALLFVNNTTMIAVHGLVGLVLAPSVALATLPVTSYVIGSAIATAPIARMMKHYGRNIGFTVGTLFGMVGVVCCAGGAYYRVFPVLCMGAALVGVYNACGQLYRFAAAEVAGTGFKERAISLVLAGGIVGGIVGPNLASYSKDWLAVTYAGSYLSLVVPAILTLFVLRQISFPAQSAAERAAGGRPLAEIMRQPVFIVACGGAVIGYGVMNLLMTATPIAMKTCGFTFSDSAHVLTLHVVGMFLPSFFTGSLIRRFGVLNIMFTGALLMFACVGIALSGVELHHFLIALMTLGLGWNFLFVGGTTLLTEAYRPEEKTKVQGANDFMIFLTMATSSFSSGALVTSKGWDILNYGALPFLVIVSCAILWLARFRRLSVAIA